MVAWLTSRGAALKRPAAAISSDDVLPLAASEQAAPHDGDHPGILREAAGRDDSSEDTEELLSDGSPSRKRASEELRIVARTAADREAQVSFGTAGISFMPPARAVMPSLSGAIQDMALRRRAAQASCAAVSVSNAIDKAAVEAAVRGAMSQSTADYGFRLDPAHLAAAVAIGATTAILAQTSDTDEDIDVDRVMATVRPVLRQLALDSKRYAH
eukprot:TRINITY_DN30731_c0_g1_i2.p1 TRINITY_DN30731_c0_g1~~TRINITY_DN30731_c0_g1_i2.p1  ORF type:complete len:214 (-),score=23.65 TRINITY_DN30731_c0_g1_i2:152-793(-)